VPCTVNPSSSTARSAGSVRVPGENRSTASADHDDAVAICATVKAPAGYSPTAPNSGTWQVGRRYRSEPCKRANA
jgi:hypothetical protein